MKLTILFFLLTFLAGQNISAQSKGSCRRILSADNHALWTLPTPRPYTVLAYDLVLDWRKVFETHSPHYSGVQNIKLQLQMTTSTNSISLDAAMLTIDSITINGSLLLPVPQPSANETIAIPLPMQLRDSGVIMNLKIVYHKDDGTRGFYFYPKGYNDQYIDTVLEDIANTFNEPTDAHYWMPCNDRPDNKAQSQVSIIVPNGITALSNGVLIDTSAYTSLSTIWHWKSDEPIATYLIVADASKFTHWEETHKRSSLPGDTVHLDYYAWQQDYNDTVTDGSKYNGRYFLSKNTSQIMTWLESRFGPFPFVKYGQVPIPGEGGGMENQSLTSVSRYWLKGDNDETIAHEMAHQWFGDKTTCESFKDIWLNEGFATFCEGIWGEGSGGDSAYSAIMRNYASPYLYGQPKPFRPVYDPPDSDVFDGWLTYAKGGCVLHMLRRMFGDSLFFNAMREYSNSFAYTTATTQQFRDAMSKSLRTDLTEFFDEWIFKSGQPTYDFAWNQDANNNLLVQVNQLQTEQDHFSMPLHFIAYHSGKIDTFAVVNNLRSQKSFIPAIYQIDSLRFDDDALILCFYTGSNGKKNYSTPIITYYGTAYRYTYRKLLLKKDPSLSVALTANSDFKVSPNPTTGTLSIRNAPENLISISILNVLGAKVMDITGPHSSDFTVDLSILPAGIYDVVFSSANSVDVRKIIKQ